VTRRKTIATFGPSRGGVRVLEEGDYARVQWYEDGQRRVKSFALTKEGRAEAKAWAQGFAETRFGTAPAAERLTLRAVWARYKVAEFPQLRERTRELYAEHWARWELFLGRSFYADDARQETVDRFRARLTVLGIAVGHQQRIMRDVKTVYAWADSRELLARNRLAGYRFKIAKEARAERPAAYQPEEVAAIIAALQPQRSGEWRAWTVLVLAAYQGARARAILHLTWSDVDITSGTVTWRAKFDKTGVERVQPLTLAGYCAVLTARWWRERDGHREPWVFPSPQARKRAGREEPGVYGAQALWLALRNAERRAGVVHRPFRAMHGFRRGVGKAIAQLTGDPMRGLDWLGDKDPKQIPAYVQGQSAELEASAGLLDAPWMLTPKPSSKQAEKHGD
jgi:integrase